MITINHSTGLPNWSQLKNVDAPFSECNVTAAMDCAQCCGDDIMALRRSTDPTKRPADDFYEFLHSDPECLALRNKISPKDEPNELMEVLAFGLGKWIKAPARVAWQPAMGIAQIVQHIIDGGCGILHGHYPTTSGKFIDHMNALVGLNYGVTYDAAGASRKDISSFIIDDPYGDYRALYGNHFGDDILMPYEDFIKYIKETGNKLYKDIILVFPKEKS